jgi:hypothetical protein
LNLLDIMDLLLPAIHVIMDFIVPQILSSDTGVMFTLVLTCVVGKSNYDFLRHCKQLRSKRTHELSRWVYLHLAPFYSPDSKSGVKQKKTYYSVNSEYPTFLCCVFKL